MRIMEIERSLHGNKFGNPKAGISTGGKVIWCTKYCYFGHNSVQAF
jgi:hypothetical protein